MDSILTELSEIVSLDLTTLDRVKMELSIQNNDSDEQIRTWIHEESETLANEMGRVLAEQTVSERFTLDGCADCLTLGRWPVISIESVSEDGGAALDASLYEVDAVAGLLYRLDASGC